MVAIVAATISLVMIAKKQWVKLVRVKLSDIKLEVVESFPLFLSTAATSVYTACFVLILGYFASPEQVGQYSAVDRIMRALCYLVLVPILQVFYPYVASLAQQNRQEASKKVKLLFLLVLVGMMFVGAFLFFASPFMVYFLGNDYLHTDWLFKVMAFVPIFVGMGGVLGQLKLLAMGNESDKRYFRNTYIVAACVAIVSVLGLSYGFGMYGTVCSLLLTEVVVFVLFMWRARG
jgi:O-antigen/teichoic acid export membrane protein